MHAIRPFGLGIQLDRRWRRRMEFLKRVVLPLGTLCLAAVALHLYYDDSGFFLDVAAGAVGVLITVGYVDSAIRTIEDRRWKGTRDAVASELHLYVSLSTRALADALHMPSFGMHIGRPELREQPVESVWSEFNWFAEAVIEKAVSVADPASLKSAEGTLLGIAREARSLLVHFGDALPPDHYRLLVEIQGLGHATEALAIEEGRVPDDVRANLGRIVNTAFQRLVELRNYLASHSGPYGL